MKIHLTTRDDYSVQWNTITVNKYKVIEYTEWKLKSQFQKHQVPLLITFKKQVPSKKHLKLKVGNLVLSTLTFLTSLDTKVLHIYYFLFSTLPNSVP